MKQDKLKEIANTRVFMNMPVSSQALYFHLYLSADENGLVDDALRIQRVFNYCEDDFWYLFKNNLISIDVDKVRINEVQL